MNKHLVNTIKNRIYVIDAIIPKTEKNIADICDDIDRLNYSLEYQKELRDNLVEERESLQCELEIYTTRE